MMRIIIEIARGLTGMRIAGQVGWILVVSVDMKTKITRNQWAGQRLSKGDQELMVGSWLFGNVWFILGT